MGDCVLPDDNATGVVVVPNWVVEVIGFETIGVIPELSVLVWPLLVFKVVGRLVLVVDADDLDEYALVKIDPDFDNVDAV